MGKFRKGQKKPNGSGRAKGTPNKRFQLLNEALEANGLDVTKKLLELLPGLPKVKQADILMGLMPYLYPRKKSVEIINNSETDNEPIVVHFVDPITKQITSSKTLGE